MDEQADSGGIISEAELNELTELFQVFEGAQIPLAQEPQTAKQVFHSKLVILYATKVKPANQSLSFTDFFMFARRICRKRMATNDRYLCP